MRRKRIRFAAALCVLLLSASACLADITGEPVNGVRKAGTVSRRPLGLEKDIFYTYIRSGWDDVVVVGLEGSGMNPHKEDTGLVWLDALSGYNIIDFSVANELELWNDKIRDPACENYSAAVVGAVKANYPGASRVGLYAFSKGASGADAVFRKLREEGFTVSFIWLNDAFTLHDLPYIKEAVEDGSVRIYLRYSRSKRLGKVCKDMCKAWEGLENVDGRHVSCSHGGLIRYDTFTAEMAAAIGRAAE